MKARVLLSTLFLLTILGSFAFVAPRFHEEHNFQRYVGLGAKEPPSKKGLTLKELSEQMKKNPVKYNLIVDESSNSNKKKTYRRSRQRVANPQQTYVYAAQRKQDNITEEKSVSIPLAREWGMLSTAQHCDPLVDNVQPRIVAQIRVSDDTGSGSFAYLIDKPAGWAIVGSSSPSAKGSASTSVPSTKSSQPQLTPEELARKKAKYDQRVLVSGEEDASVDVFEYNELDVLALMTPEELQQYREEGGDPELLVLLESTRKVNQLENGATKSSYKEMTAEEIEAMDKSKAENVRRIAARQARMSGKATFAEWSRPSVVTWLKDLKAQEGMPIRGGKFWTAVTGATDVDDSGLVLLAPRTHAENVFVDYAEYFVTVGNGEQFTPNTKLKDYGTLPSEHVKMNLLSTLKTAREGDIVTTAKIFVSESKSTCSAIIPICEERFANGIRGDAVSEPFDRRARRRLMHCHSMSVSSLLFDETAEIELETIPDDIAIFSKRGTQKFLQGSFLGRQSLRLNPKTSCYREINGAADGYPGWVVDRYDKWLFVQHDSKHPRGPLPSIHDGYTLGVYYLESQLDRSQMGASGVVRPRLLEGKEAPESLEVVENGVRYVVSLDKDLSTGIFLDQRPQRAWLTRHCNENTSVLNCFAHTGAFSVAAASAGAHTVSVDLSSRWLERLPEHLSANGIDFDARHDCITGDCFDWLSRLSKRGEKYDIVIVDPPSTSVGRTKKRWSIKNDMDELVALAASLVKDGGLLWATTNSASISPVKFARLCRKGLEAAGKADAKLERMQPMPNDFPSVGAPPVKNLVWRLP